MSITVELWEDSGTATGSPATGTTRQSVSGFSWRSAAYDESYPYVDYPIRRPDTDGSTPYFYTSYTKYNYFKMSGTYPLSARIRANLIGNVGGAGVAGFTSTDDVRLYYKWTNVYETPTASLMSGPFVGVGSSLTWAPMLSTTGPESATSKINSLVANTTYYTSYLVTQLYVEPGVWTKYGNIGDIKIQFTVDEYESTDI